MKRARTFDSGDSQLEFFFGNGGGDVGNAPDWMIDLPLRVPDSMVQNKPYRAPRLLRMEKRLALYQQGTFGTNANNIMIWEFPDQDVIDFRGGFVMMDVVVGATGGTYKRLAQGIWSMFDKVVVKFGPMQDEILYYNRSYSFRWNTMIDPGVQSTIGYDLLGLGLQSDRNTWGADAAGMLSSSLILLD